MMNFANIRIVLIDTSHPGNIGATARAMKTMCLDHLYLVNPQRYPCAEATARASSANDLLARARVCTSLDAALQDCGLVIGASARMRSLSWPQLDPRQAAERLVEEGRQAPVAVIFGRENSGLTNEELERCHYLMHIPGNPEYNSLNLAAAVQVVAYEIMMAALLHDDAPKSSAEEPPDYASATETEAFYAHMEQVLIEIGFLDPAKPRFLMRRLRRLFIRARLDKNEVNILRGILTAVRQSRAPAGSS
jgi:TrmH family RNA methyltransferase